jgi:hypothetical protein
MFLIVELSKKNKKNILIISQVIKALRECYTRFIHICEGFEKAESRIIVEIHVMNDGEMTPCRYIPADESKDFFCGIYIFEDVFIPTAVPMIAINCKLVSLFKKGYRKLIRSTIDQSTHVLMWA